MYDYSELDPAVRVDAYINKVKEGIMTAKPPEFFLVAGWYDVSDLMVWLSVLVIII